MNNDLIERYIYAVTQYLPHKIRADVEKELDSLIADMLNERCGDIQPEERDIRIVLTELGSPDELAAKYCGKENQSLVSGAYYLVYMRILKLVLPIAALGIAFASTMNLFTGWDSSVDLFDQLIEALTQLFAAAIGGVIQAFAIITLVFAVLERKKVVSNNKDMLSHLPHVPKDNERIKPHEAVIGILLTVIGAIVFLAFPQFVGIWNENTGWISVFDPSVIHSLWSLVVIWVVLSIIKEIVKLIESQYTKRLAIITVVCDLVIAAGTLILFLSRTIINPIFLDSAESLLFEGGDGSQIPVLVAGNLNIILLCVVLFALIIEIATVSFKAWKYNRND